MKSPRPKILCLGVSYPNVEEQLKVSGQTLSSSCTSDIDGSCMTNNCSALDVAMECVQRGILTQMDGRDLARCVSTEQHCNVDVYCVSQEKGAIYRSDRHLDANFNRSAFVKTLQKHFGEDCSFDQIILDYYWIPAGWDRAHWRPTFFVSTLLNFAKSRVIYKSSSMTRHSTLYRRGIYLPFCFHCFKAIVSNYEALQKFYNISFLRKGELANLTLWAGTQHIGSHRMQHVLGKRIDQEEIYCTFGPQHIQEMEDGNASKEELVTLASSLEDFPDIRFIVLEPIQPLRPVRRVQSSSTGEEFGRFLGLVHPSTVKRGFRYVDVGSTSGLIPPATPTLLRLKAVPSSRNGGERIAAQTDTAATSSDGTIKSRLRRRSPVCVTADVSSAIDDSGNSKAMVPKSLFR